MNELAPGWPLVVEEATVNHCVATCGDVVLLFCYAGSHADPQHALTAQRVVERLARHRKEQVRILIVLPQGEAPPPTAPVRSALLGAVKAAGLHVSRGSLVVPGTGFTAAVHRAVVTSIVTLVPSRIQSKVTNDVGAAVEFLLGADAPVLAPLLRFCAERRAEPPAGT